jgi:hypothetical protein
VVKLVDALDSKSSIGNYVRVRFPPPAYRIKTHEVVMTNWFKTIFALVLMCTFSFAQDDFGFESSGGESSSAEETSASPSHNSNSENSKINSEASASETESKTVGSATATSDPWEGFRYEDAGLTQWEFQQAKESGMSREMLTRLVELGVRPSEYIQKPWERLGVTEDAWLKEREQGLEDSDIDRSYRNRNINQDLTYWSILVPSLYQWKTNETITAVWIDALWVVGVGGLAYFVATSDENKDIWQYWLIPILGAHIWSFADAFFGTQWENNPDANRFSLGIGPSLNRGVAGLLQMRF